MGALWTRILSPILSSRSCRIPMREWAAGDPRPAAPGFLLALKAGAQLLLDLLASAGVKRAMAGIKNCRSSKNTSLERLGCLPLLRMMLLLLLLPLPSTFSSTILLLSYTILLPFCCHCHYWRSCPHFTNPIPLSLTKPSLTSPSASTPRGGPRSSAS